GAGPVRGLAATAAGTGPDSAVAVGLGRSAGPHPRPQSHRHGTPTRLLQLEEAGRDGHWPRAVRRPGVYRVAHAPRRRQAVSVRAGRWHRGQQAPATAGLRCRRGRGPGTPFLERPVMLQITPQMKILVAIEPADFRRGIDGLARLCQQALDEDPFAGAVFVFRNRKATALKVLM